MASSSPADDIMRKIGMRAFGGVAPAKRSTTPPAGTAPKKTASAGGLFQGLRTHPDPVPEKKVRVPAIILDNIDDWPKHAAKMKTLVGDDFDAVFRGTRYRIKTTTPDSFRAVQRYCFNENISFHTFSLGGLRTFKAVIRGLPDYVDDLMLADALTDARFAVDECTKLRTTRGPTKSWLVTFSPDSERCDPDMKSSKAFMTITHLCHVRVTISPYKRPPGPPQCHRCQGFGHGSGNCGRPEKCVRCGGAHRKNSCSKPNDEAGTCCNCGGPHNASYRGCKAFKTAKARQIPKARRQPETRPSEETPERPKNTTDPPDDEESDSESSGFETVKRRKRSPRNPANRHQGRAQQPAPTRDNPNASLQPRQTMKRRLDWPPVKPPQITIQRRLAPEPPVTAAMQPSTAAPELQVPAAKLTQAPDFGTFLTELLRQLTSLTGTITQYLAIIRQG